MGALSAFFGRMRVRASGRRRSVDSRGHSSRGLAKTRMRCAADLGSWPGRRLPTHSNVSRTVLLNFNVPTRTPSSLSQSTLPRGSNLKKRLGKRSLEVKGSKEAVVDEFLDSLDLQQNDGCFPPVAEDPPRIRHRHRLPAALCPGHSQDVWVDGEIPPESHPEDPETFLRWLLSNSTQLQLIFLGTSSWHPTLQRSLPSLALRTSSDIWLFDVGEDTQRQCMKHPLTRPGKISRIFLTSSNADVLFGLPGVLCSIAASRDRMGALTDQPVHVYGPLGTGTFINSLMEISQTMLQMPVIVHEFWEKPSLNTLEVLTSRAKLWCVKIAPDGLCEKGCYDAQLDARRPALRKFLKKGRKTTFLNTVDPRAGFLPFEAPRVGDPKKFPLQQDEIRWTLNISAEFRVVVFPLNEARTSLGYRIEEAHRAGNLDADKATALGIERGPKFKTLKEGGAVANQNGDLITSAMVMGPNRPGRTLSILAEPPCPESCIPVIRHADYVLLPIGKNDTDQTGLTAAEAVDLCKGYNVQNLIFSRQLSTSRCITLFEVRLSLCRDVESVRSVEAAVAESSISVAAASDLDTHILPAAQSGVQKSEMHF